MMSARVRNLSGNLATLLSQPWEIAEQLRNRPILGQSAFQRVSTVAGFYFFSVVGAPLKAAGLLLERIAPRRVAIIGYGYMGKMYAQLLPSQHFKLVGVYDKDPKQCELLPQNLRFSKRNELIARPDVDVVIIATPHMKHLKVLKKCLQHKKQVILEKPLAGSFEDATQIYSLIQQHRQSSKVIVNITHCFYKNIQIAKQYIDNAAIGNIKSIHDRVMFPIKNEERTAGIFKKAVAGHGVMLTNGCHLVARVAYLFSKYKPSFEFVKGSFSNPDRLGDIEDAFAEMHLQLILPEGKKIPVTIHASWPMEDQTGPLIEESMGINTDKGKLHVQAWKGISFYANPEKKLSHQVPFNSQTISPEISKGTVNMLKEFKNELASPNNQIHFSVEYTYQAERMIAQFYQHRQNR